MTREGDWRQSTIGITAIGTYVPRLRLRRSSIAAAMGWLAPGLANAARGERTLGFWDEDSTTMGVEAARDCLSPSGAPVSRDDLSTLVFATTTPVFAERQNASIIHRALQLPESCSAQDTGGTVRGGLLGLQQLLEGGQAGLIVAADRPLHPAGSIGEIRSGDGAAAAAVGPGPNLLDYLGGAGLTSGFVDRYRATGRDFAMAWEERWVREEGYLKLVPTAIRAALAKADLAASDIDWLVLPCTIPGVAASVAKGAGLERAKLGDPLAETCGDTGSAHALLMLAKATEEAAPGDRILVTQLGQGASALVFQVTEAIADMRPAVSERLAGGHREENYLKLPVFSGLLPWEQGLRGRTAVNEALTVADRYEDAILGFVGGRCRETGAVQFPPSRIGASRQAPLVDTQMPWPLADRGGRVASRTADSLAFSHHPPSCYGLVDFHGGGRLMMDFTDPEAPSLGVGDEVRFVFRIKDKDVQSSYRRYFWKAVPASSATVEPRE